MSQRITIPQLVYDFGNTSRELCKRILAVQESLDNTPFFAERGIMVMPVPTVQMIALDLPDLTEPATPKSAAVKRPSRRKNKR